MSAYRHLPLIFQQLIEERLVIDMTGASDAEYLEFFSACDARGISANSGNSGQSAVTYGQRCLSDGVLCFDLDTDGGQDGRMDLLMNADRDFYDDRDYTFVPVAVILAEIRASTEPVCDNGSIRQSLYELLGGVPEQ